MPEKEPTYMEKARDVLFEALLSVDDKSYASYSEHKRPEPNQATDTEGENNKPKKTQNPEDPPVLNSTNHSFYIGKMRRTQQDIRSRISRALGFTPPEKIYSEDFIEASLAYLFKHSAKDEPVHIMICRSLSEILNGPKDVEGTLTAEEEKEEIYRIAAKKFGKTKDDLIIELLEDSSEHAKLIRALREATDDVTNEFDGDKVFGLDPETEEGLIKDEAYEATDSFSIMRQLYLATKQNEKFANRVKKGVPQMLKRKDPNEEDLPKSYYTMAELAIRIYEISMGRNIHSGTNRQSVYDEVIVALVKGEKGPFRSIPALKPIFKLLENCTFHTIHIDNKNNPYRAKKVRSNARKKLTTALAVCTTAVTTTVWAPVATYKAVNSYNDYQRQKAADEAVKKYIVQHTEGLTFRLEGTRAPITTRTVEYQSKAMQNDLFYRYGVAPEVQQKLNLSTLSKQFLVENKRISRTAAFGSNYFTWYLEDFIQQNDLLFKSHGVEIGRPYEHMMPYMDLFIKAAEQPVPPQRVTFDVDSTSPCALSRNCYPDYYQNNKLTYLGIYMSHQPLGVTNQFFVLENPNGEKVLLSRPYYDEESNELFSDVKPGDATTMEAMRDARRFIEDMKLIDAYPITEWASQLSDLVRSIPPEFEEEEPVDAYTLLDARTYKDTFGAFNYQVIKGYCHFTHRPDDVCVKARVPGVDTDFSVARGREVAHYFLLADGRKLYQSYPDFNN